jgi:hypothetical protein
MCCIKIGSIVDFVDIEERYLKIKKYSTWKIKIGSNILPERYEDKHSKNVKCSGDVQLHAVSRLLEAKPCA